MTNLLEKVLTLEVEAAEFGFCWETPAQIMVQIQSECDEINEHFHEGISEANTRDLQEEIGDLLHAAFSLCIFCGFSPKETLEKTLNKFERRMKAVKSIAGEQGLTTLEGQNFEDLMQVWKQAKERVG